MLKTPKLELNLIPATSWWKNARSELSKSRWNEIRKEIYRQANYTCEICGVKDERLDCNELWEYVSVSSKEKSEIRSKNREVGHPHLPAQIKVNKQILVGLEAICRMCHLTQHYGYATVIRKDLETFNHLLKINNWTNEQGKIYIQKKFQEWEERSKKKWILDLSIIKTL